MTIPITADAARRMRRLTDVSRALTYADSLDNVLDLTVDCACDLLGAGKALVMLGDDNGLLRIRAARGIEPDRIARFGEPLDENIISRLEGMLGPDAKDRFLAVPLVVRRSVIGLLAVTRAEPGEPTEEEEWLLSALGDQTSIALDGARREETRASLESQIIEMDHARAQTRQALRIAGHDLRTPLNAMQGYTDMLASGVFGAVSDRQKDVLQRVQSIGRHFVSLLENALEMAGLLSGASNVATRVVPLAEVAGEAVAMIGPAADRKHIALRSELDGGVHALVDPDCMRQVITHLLDNAVKYSPEGTSVLVTCGTIEHDGGSWAAIVVQDQGPGIPPDKVEEIFAPYHRLSTARAGDPGGSGLGLAIARNLIGLMNGFVEIVDAPDAGATFRIRVPLASPPTPDAGQPA